MPINETNLQEYTYEVVFPFNHFKCLNPVLKKWSKSVYKEQTPETRKKLMDRGQFHLGKHVRITLDDQQWRLINDPNK